MPALFEKWLRELLKTSMPPRPRRQIADTPHAIYANKQVRLAIFGKVKHTALHDKRRLQNDLFGTSTAPTGKTLGHAAKSMLRKNTRILLNRGQRRLKENVAAELS